LLLRCKPEKKKPAQKKVTAVASAYVERVMEKEKEKEKDKQNICIKKPVKPRAKKVEEPEQNYCSETVSVELVEEEYLERI
jgi:hypothetical protein